MAHVLQAYLLALQPRPAPACGGAAGCSSAPRACPPTSASACTSPRSRRCSDDDYEAARATLGELLRLAPARRAGAAGGALRSTTSAATPIGMNERVGERAAGAGRSDLPGYHAVLAMHAFGLEECGDYDEAEASARAALALDPLDARAHHVMAHVFEMTDRAEAGVRWLDRPRRRLGRRHRRRDPLLVAPRPVPARARASPTRALASTTSASAPAARTPIADLIDASALLWRVELAGGDAGARWLELADAWAPHIDDGFCSFNDLHAMLAFVGARDWHARRPARARAAHGARAADAPRRDDAAARPGRVPRADRVRPRRRHAGDHAAGQPAGAGAPPRRQPCAARRAAPDAGAGRRAPARGERVVDRRSRREGGVGSRLRLLSEAAPAGAAACRLRPVLRLPGIGRRRIDRSSLLL